MQILDKIDYETFREIFKIFVGFSDETTIDEKSGVITFHRPMIGCAINYKETKCFDNLFDILMNPRAKTELHNIDDNSLFKVFKLVRCESQVFGGNICLIQSLIGTQYEPKYKDKFYSLKR